MSSISSPISSQPKNQGGHQLDQVEVKVCGRWRVIKRLTEPDMLWPMLIAMVGIALLCRRRQMSARPNYH